MARPAVPVETADDLVGLLDHRRLILADRDDGGLERGNVRRLRGRVAQEARRDIAAEAAAVDLVLDRRVALESGDGHEVQIEHRQLGQRGQGGLHADRGRGRVDPDGKVVGRDLQDVRRTRSRLVRVVGQRLGVGEQQELAVAVLERHAVAQRADIVPEVQRAGGAVAGQNNGSGHGVSS